MKLGKRKTNGKNNFRSQSGTNVAGSQINTASVQNFSASNRVQRESRLLTTKQQPSTTSTLPVGKERLRGTSVSSNESIGEVTTRRSVRQSTASPLATPASNTRGASRSLEDVNRRKTRSGAGEWNSHGKLIPSSQPLHFHFYSILFLFIQNLSLRKKIVCFLILLLLNLQIYYFLYFLHYFLFNYLFWIINGVISKI